MYRLIALIVLLCCPLAQAAGTESRDMRLHWQVATETKVAVAIDDIDTIRLNWHSSRWQAPNLGFVSGFYWMRLDIQPNELASGRWRLWIHNSLLSVVSFYLISNGKVLAHQEDGLEVRWSARSSLFRSPAFALNIQPDRPYRIYLRVRSETALQVPAELVSEADFLARKEQSDITLGLFLGVLLAMVSYNLLLFGVTREFSFLLYVAHACSLLMFVVSWQGLGANYLWPGWIALQSASIAFATFLVIGFSSWFCMVFLELSRQNFASFRLFVAVRNLAFIGVLITPLLPFRVAIFASSALSFPAVLLVANAIVSRASLRYRPTRLFALGWALYVTGAFMMGLNKFGVIEVSYASENMLLWSTVMDMVLMCIALGDRFFQKRRKHVKQQRLELETASQQLESLQSKLRQERTAIDMLAEKQARQLASERQLQQRLRERARDLELLQQQLKHASDTDSLTGLKNREFFADRLMAEIERSLHLGGDFCLLIVDVDRFRRINENYGHLAGDECLCQISEILRQQLKRPADVLCRLGGEKFAVLLPDTQMAGAMQLAEIMRARIAECPLMCAGHGIMVTVSVGVTEIMSNAELRPERVLNHAHLALQRAKSDGRNCVAAIA